MKPPKNYLNGIGNLNFEDPALICSEVECLDNNDNETSANDIYEPQLNKELEFDLCGPSEIT